MASESYRGVMPELGNYEIHTENVVLDVDGEPMSAYVARPTEAGDHPGVVIAFEMFGLTSYIREVTDRVASLGYVAVAPDFYHRADPGIELKADEDGRRRGFELLDTLTRGGALADVEAAMAYTAADKVAMVGCSAGGHIAYLAAAELGFAATAVFYGGWLTGTELPISRPEPTLSLTPAIAGKLLYLVGDSDHAVPAEQVDRIAAALAGSRHELVVYPDTGHGFFCHQRDSYREGPAADAWRRVTDLFEAELH
ncbi:MAG: dienelactone hydrolase family protein [Amycolatopsis sp.]|nr:dienelactone hydrolase family protein [Amycolatopsis sp.]